MRIFWPLLQLAIDHAHQHDDAEIGIVPAVDQQRLQRRVARRPWARGRRCTIASSTSSILRPVLAEMGIASRGVDADHVLDLLAHALGLGGRQVDLVEHRHDFEIGVDRLIDIGERLRFHALARIHHQQRAFAGGQAAAHLIGEVHMAGRVHQVEDVGLAVLAPCIPGARSAP